MNKITDLKKILNNSINKLNNRYIKRNRKLSFEDIIYGLSLKTINHYTYDKVSYTLNNKLVKNFSPSAFKKKCDILENRDITYLNNQLLNNIYNNKYEKRILSVDGSYLKTLKNLKNDGLKFPGKNYNNYTNSIISGLYDVDKKIIINYNHSINKNEREAFIDQLKYVKRGDILIFDRGYYSEEIINILNNNKIDYVFRVIKSILSVKYLIKNNLKEYTYFKNNKYYKIVNYKIDNPKDSKDSNDYYILTSLINLNIDELKNIYWKRWSIETHFKEAKYTTSLSNLNCKSLNNLLKDINMHNFVYILYYYFYNFIKTDCKSYELNHKLGLEIFINDILFILIYKKKYKNEIIKIIKILPKTYKHLKTDRHFTRISKIKVSKWYINHEKEEIKIKKQKIYIELNECLKTKIL
jgi:hypothetical protein